MHGNLADRLFRTVFHFIGEGLIYGKCGGAGAFVPEFHAVKIIYMYTADFYGLLFHLKVPMEYHYAVLRVNGLRNPSDFQGTEDSVVIPDTDIIKRLLNTLKTQIKKNPK